MKNTAVSSSVPNIKNIPKISTSNGEQVQTQQKTPLPQSTSNATIAPINGSTGLTGLENTEGNFASSYIPPNEEILAEFAFAEEVYKKNKRKYQRMLASPAIQHFMIEGEQNQEEAQILFKP